MVDITVVMLTKSQYGIEDIILWVLNIIFVPLTSPQTFLLGCTVSPVNSQPAFYKASRHSVK